MPANNIMLNILTRDKESEEFEIAMTGDTSKRGPFSKCLGSSTCEELNSSYALTNTN